MSRMKLVFAVLVLTVSVGIVPLAQAAPTVQVMIAGSSAMWQALALGAYDLCGGAGSCYHWTSSANFNLTDTRPATPVTDPGGIWIVGDNAGTKVWAYIKVDSVVGNRCYFAQPRCGVSTTNGAQAAGNAISSALWGADTATASLPAGVMALFSSASVPVTVAATDIRPEDAAFAQCRVNSTLGGSAAAGANSDGLDGLGYNAGNPAGQCPAFDAATGNANPKLVGAPIKSGYPGSTATAAVVAFNISGTDPFNKTKIPTGTVFSVGAAPIIFIVNRGGNNKLDNLANASEAQLQQVFSGSNCDASAFGLPAGPMNVFLREPLSGTMNTTEATVFRQPTLYPSFKVLGLSQETGVGTSNPLAGKPCGVSGKRYRGIGTGEVVKGVQNSDSALPDHWDGISYTFFSYGNISSIANNAKYGYIQLDGVDPLFATYFRPNNLIGPAAPLDPGQPAQDQFGVTASGILPAAANAPAACAGAFPCDEAKIWKGGFSFPNLRNGTYRAWSLLRIVSDNSTGTRNQLLNAEALVKAGQKHVVQDIPDYVPALAVPGTTTKDLGLKLVRSHYLQKDGNNALLSLKAGAAANSPENGGDMGGCILPTTIGVTYAKQTQLVNNMGYDSADASNAAAYSTGCAAR